MFVCPYENRIFLVAPKTGSTAVRKYLRTQRFYPAQLTGGPVLNLRGGTNKNHNWLTEHPGDGWSVATTVRNHWDALVSWWSYTYINRGEQEIEPFIHGLLDDATHQDWFWPDPHRMWGAYTAHADAVLRHETLEADLSRWLGHSVDLSRENVSPQRDGRHYSEFYTPDLRAFVGDWYREEIAELGYSFDSPQ